MAEKSKKARASWMAVITVLWILSWLIAEAIPVFHQMLGVIGAAFTTWFCLGFNSMFWLHMQRAECHDGRSMFFMDWRRGALTMLNVFIIIVSASIVGTSSLDHLGFLLT